MLNATMKTLVHELHAKGWHYLEIENDEHPLQFRNKIRPVVNQALDTIGCDYILVGQRQFVFADETKTSKRFAVEVVLTRTVVTEDQYWQCQLDFRRAKQLAADKKSRAKTAAATEPTEPEPELTVEVAKNYSRTVVCSKCGVIGKNLSKTKVDQVMTAHKCA